MCLPNTCIRVFHAHILSLPSQAMCSTFDLCTNLMHHRRCSSCHYLRTLAFTPRRGHVIPWPLLHRMRVGVLLEPVCSSSFPAILRLLWSRDMLIAMSRYQASVPAGDSFPFAPLSPTRLPGPGSLRPQPCCAGKHPGENRTSSESKDPSRREGGALETRGRERESGTTGMG
jgi:hypothetical protein